ncbi:hypothetical protein niasHT_010115 [Heterodera trifolii]|uniref:Uncharacterized protein n=1 Tax=Heterodera trifolii TaxID=157864 RepID=A0ABD2LZ60_9BILA
MLPLEVLRPSSPSQFDADRLRAIRSDIDLGKELSLVPPSDANGEWARGDRGSAIVGLSESDEQQQMDDGLIEATLDKGRTTDITGEGQTEMLEARLPSEALQRENAVMRQELDRLKRQSISKRMTKNGTECNGPVRQNNAKLTAKILSATNCVRSASGIEPAKDEATAAPQIA